MNTFCIFYDEEIERLKDMKLGVLKVYNDTPGKFRGSYNLLLTVENNLSHKIELVL